MRGIHRHYNGEIDGEGIEPPINSDHFGAFGRGGILKTFIAYLKVKMGMDGVRDKGGHC